jgi:iron complex transport system ATP-binding protein
MQTLVALRQARNVGILAVIHDLSLAGIGFDRVVLLAGGRIIADGTASEVITEVNVSTGFDAPVKVWQDGTKVRVVLDPTSSIVIPRVRDSNDA